MRKEHPGCGVEKMYYTLKPKFLGRDNFIDIFMDLGYRVDRPKNYIRTTYSSHLKFPNLIEAMEIYGPNQLWQTDITYFHLSGKFYYLVFILDVYTRKIIGYNVSDNMRVESNIIALKQALKSCSKTSLATLVHHSDRGSQYTSTRYLNLLKTHNIKVSMGFKAQDNAYVERVNGIMKNEYLYKWQIRNFKELKRKLKKAITHYNGKRIHRSLPNRTTPDKFEQLVLNLNDHKKLKMVIYKAVKK